MFGVPWSIPFIEEHPASAESATNTEFLIICLLFMILYPAG